MQSIASGIPFVRRLSGGSLHMKSITLELTREQDELGLEFKKPCILYETHKRVDMHLPPLSGPRRDQSLNLLCLIRTTFNYGSRVGQL